MEDSMWRINGGGNTWGLSGSNPHIERYFEYDYSVIAGIFAFTDVYSGCCYCQWDGPPAALTKSYFVNIDGKDSNSVRLRLLDLALLNDSWL
jgi:hypothetical protein